MSDNYNYADNYYEFDDEEDTLDLNAPVKSGCSGACGGCSGGSEKTKKEDCDCDGNCGDDCKCDDGCNKEPRDNDGREYCFWCGKKTVLVDGFRLRYDYCKECKK